MALLVLGVEEPAHAVDAAAPCAPLRPRAPASLPGAFWSALAVGAVFALSRFSAALLVFRAREVGLPVALVPVVMIARNLVYAAVSTPAGHLSAHVDRRHVLGGAFPALALNSCDRR